MTRAALRASAAAGVLLGLLAAATPSAAADQEQPTRTPIKHFIYLMQENHTFDNYFGTRPGVDGIPKDTCMPYEPGKAKPCLKPFHIRDRAITDLEHTSKAFEKQYNGGRMDGFLTIGQNRGGPDSFTGGESGTNVDHVMGYYDDRDLPYYWNIADEYVLFDRFFSSSASGSVRNHMFRVTGGPGLTGKSEGVPDKGWPDSIETIFDRLDDAGVSWKFYVQNYDPTITFRNRVPGDPDRGAQVIWVPLLAFPRFVDDPKMFNRIVHLDEYYEDLATGNLPAVAFIAPGGASEHPPGSIRSGQTFVRSMITALMRSPHWSASAFLWTYDDWGGWYDHVKPPKVDEYGYGFRVPALMVSAHAKRGHVESTTLDFTSPLKFIQYNWDLPPLASRDAKSNNFLTAFDFTKPRDAVLLGTERNPPEPPVYNRSAVYVIYAVVLGLVALVIAVVTWLDRRDRKVDQELDYLLTASERKRL